MPPPKHGVKTMPTVLCIDDDRDILNLLERILTAKGFTVITVADGEQGLVEARRERPDLILLDIMMPGIDGREVLRRIRAQPTDRPPYILILTGIADKKEIVNGLDAGANDYLIKPFDSGELQARIEGGRRMVEMQGELVRSLNFLAHQAMHDPLTGLPNRRAILDRLDNEFARAERHSALLTVGMCDVDHFKSINDTYGHQTGDDVLRELARVLTGCCRKYDAVGRMGGEEFLLIAPMKVGTDLGSRYVRICTSVAGTRMATRSGPLSVTVSIGVAVASGEDTVDTLLGAADATLYRAKTAGRNRVVLADKRIQGGDQ